MRPLRPLLTLLVCAGTALVPAAAQAALPPQLVAADCPGGADCAPPTDQSAGPTGFTRTTTATLRGSDGTSGSGLARMEYVLDGGAVTSAVWGQTIPLGTDGPHTLHTRAVDGAGNSSAWREWAFHIDTAAPSDFTATPPTAWSPTSPVQLTLLGADVAGGSGLARMEYRIGSGATQALASGDPVAIGAEGATAVHHRAVDLAGNASDWRTSTVRVDTAAPADTTAVPSGWSAGEATVTLGGTDLHSGVDVVRWRVPGGPTQTATAGSSLPVQTSGVSTIETQVVDRAGNASAWRPNTIRVDANDPVDTTGAPTGWQTSSPVTVAVSGTDGQSGVARVEWMLNSGTVNSRTTTPAAVAVTGDGIHELRTRIVDGAGRQTDWKPHTVRIDTTDPTNNTTVPAGWSTGPVDVTLAGADAGSGVARIEWSLVGGGITNGGPGTVVRIESDGIHVLRTTVVDLAGRRTTVDRTISIDRAAPTDTTTVPARVPYGPTGRIPLAGTDGPSGVARAEWKVDDGAVVSGPAGSRVDLGGPGPHTLEHRLVDNAGNVSPWRRSTVVVDPTLNDDRDDPVDTTEAPAAWQTTSPVRVPVVGTDPTTAVGLVRWRLDGGSVQTGTPGSHVVLTGDGVHRFDTQVLDLLARSSGWRSHEVRVDSAVPEDGTVAGSWQREPHVTLTGTDTLSGIGQMQWSLAAGPRQTGPSGSTVGPLTEGEHRLEHRAVDVAGNTSAWRTSTVRVDLTDPVDRTAAVPTAWQTAPLTVAPTGTDALSGLDAVDVELDGTAVTARPVVVAADGAHVLRTRARDRAGNVTAWRAQPVRVDRSAPVLELGCTPSPEPTGHRCRGAASDATSGLATLRMRSGDGDWTDLPADGATLDVASGVVELEATDLAGNTARTLSEPLAERVPAPVLAPPAATPAPRPSTPAPTPTPTPVATPRPAAPASPPRSRRVTVARRGGGSDGILGSFVLSSTPGADGAEVAADARPLALGAGRQRIVLHLRAGQLRAQRVRVVRLSRRGGYSPRMGVALSGVRRPAVARLTVARRQRGRWVTVATATTRLKP